MNRNKASGNTLGDCFSNVSQDDGEEVEEMPEIELSSDSEGEVHFYDPPNFKDSGGSRT